jgi:hypothetical protein
MESINWNLESGVRIDVLLSVLFFSNFAAVGTRLIEPPLI